MFAVNRNNCSTIVLARVIVYYIISIIYFRKNSIIAKRNILIKKLISLTMKISKKAPTKLK